MFNLVVLAILVGLAALVGSAVGTLLIAKLFDPEAKSRRATLFEQAKNQLGSKDPYVRAVGALALGDVAIKEPDYRGLVIKLFGEFLQRHTGGTPTEDQAVDGDTSPV
ncbi:MAG TPA: hypothetical protein VEI97_05675, partial [bacterium]|nr:hypothetical protein [bacterium]